MTAVSMINPYAPQPVSPAWPIGLAPAQTVVATDAATSSKDAGTSSDQAGQGAGNGTGTGGPQLAMMLKNHRDQGKPQDASPKSVVEAQSEADPASEFLARQERQKIEAHAAEQARAAAKALARAAQAQAEADRAARPEYVMPNPLPTAPILKADDV